MGFEVQQTFDEVVNSPEHVGGIPAQARLFITNTEIASGLISVEGYIYPSTYLPNYL